MAAEAEAEAFMKKTVVEWVALSATASKGQRCETEIRWGSSGWGTQARRARSRQTGSRPRLAERRGGRREGVWDDAGETRLRAHGGHGTGMASGEGEVRRKCVVGAGCWATRGAGEHGSSARAQAAVRAGRGYFSEPALIRQCPTFLARADIARHSARHTTRHTTSVHGARPRNTEAHSPAPYASPAVPMSAHVCPPVRRLAAHALDAWAAA